MTAEQHAAMAARARTHVTTNFTLARLQSETLGVYDALLGTTMAQAFARV